MPTEAEVRDVLATINDPELHRSIVELNMVRGIRISGPSVEVDIALTIAGCPLKSFFQEALPAKIKASFPEITKVQVNLGAMTEQERQALVGAIKPGGGATAVSPFSLPESTTNVIMVASGKGGVGKSTVAVNMAASLAAKGHSVGLLDADVYGFSTSRMTGMRDRATIVDERLIVPLEVFGFKMFSMGNIADESTPIVWRGPKLHKFVQALLCDVHWGDPEYLLIDSPPGTGDIAITLLQTAPGSKMVLVTTPQQTASRVAERAGEFARGTGLGLVGIVENMSYQLCGTCGERLYPFGTGGGRELSEKFEIPLLGQIPIDSAMRDFADHGRPAVVELPGGPSAVVFEEIVNQIVTLVPPRSRSLLRRPLPLSVAGSSNGR